MPMKLDEGQLREYLLINETEYCIFCGSDEIGYSEFAVANGKGTRECECYDCDGQWEETWNLEKVVKD